MCTSPEFFHYLLEYGWCSLYVSGGVLWFGYHFPLGSCKFWRYIQYILYYMGDGSAYKLDSCYLLIHVDCLNLCSLGSLSYCLSVPTGRSSSEISAHVSKKRHELLLTYYCIWLRMDQQLLPSIMWDRFRKGRHTLGGYFSLCTHFFVGYETRN